jgi:hypothetical protein
LYYDEQDKTYLKLSEDKFGGMKGFDIDGKLQFINNETGEEKSYDEEEAKKLKLVHE